MGGEKGKQRVKERGREKQGESLFLGACRGLKQKKVNEPKLDTNGQWKQLVVGMRMKAVHFAFILKVDSVVVVITVGMHVDHFYTR